MFDDNNQDQKQQQQGAAQNPALPSEPTATPPAGGTLGFSGNAIDSESSLATSITPLSGSSPIVTAPVAPPISNAQPTANTPPAPPAQNDDPLMSDDSGVSLPEPHIGSDDVVDSTPTLPEPPVPEPPAMDNQTDPMRGTVADMPSVDPPVDDNAPADETPDTTPDSNEPNFDLPEITPTGTPDDNSTDETPSDSATSTTDTNDEPAGSTTTGELEDIKQQALQQLSPLVSHLDQTPEEKFHTTMMMIQATDDESLIPSAYTTAQQIQDEKAKAQALLELINEVNYFISRANNSKSGDA